MECSVDIGISAIDTAVCQKQLIDNNEEYESTEVPQARDTSMENLLEITLEKCHQEKKVYEKFREDVSSVNNETTQSISPGTTDSFPTEDYEKWGLGNDFMSQYHSIMNLVENGGEFVYNNSKNNDSKKDVRSERILSLAIALLVILGGLAFTFWFSTISIDNDSSEANITGVDAYQQNLTMPPSSFPSLNYESSNTSLAPSASKEYYPSSSPTHPPSLQNSTSLYPNGTNHNDDIMSYVRFHPEASNYKSSYAWKSLGKEIYINSYQRHYINSFAISSSGNLLVIGLGDQEKVCVFQYLRSNNTWSTMTEIKGPSSSEFGKALSISDNGLVLAIGGPSFNSKKGVIRMYTRELNSNNWFQMGFDIIGKYHNIKLGQSISLSGDGQTLITGSGDSDFAQSFQWNGNEWQKKGLELHGDVGSYFGRSVSITYNGDMILVGAPKGMYVEVYKWSNSSWEIHGRRINNFVSNSEYGYSVSISSNGDTLAVGAPGYYDDSEGKVYVYKWDAISYYVQKGDYIQAETKNAGSSVLLSKDGAIVSFNSYQNNCEGTTANIVSWIGTSWNYISTRIHEQEILDFIIPSDDSLFAIEVSINDLNDESVTKISVYSLAS